MFYIFAVICSSMVLQCSNSPKCVLDKLDIYSILKEKLLMIHELVILGYCNYLMPAIFFLTVVLDVSGSDWPGALELSKAIHRSTRRW